MAIERSDMPDRLSDREAAAQALKLGAEGHSISSELKELVFDELIYGVGKEEQPIQHLAELALE